MTVKIPKIDEIPVEDQTSWVLTLLECIDALAEENQALRDEIARLKGEKARPRIKPSSLEGKHKKPESSEQRPGSAKRNKTQSLEIHEIVKVAPENLPSGSTFKGYKNFVVQGLEMKPHNIRYRLERWESPDGRILTGKLPAELNGSHFDVYLKRFILYQYYHGHVTQPILLEQLHDIGFDISSGQLNNIIIENHDGFHDEKDAILNIGLSVSTHINVDDTTARHEGQNGYCTHIGNEFFATFHSTDSKSRINFLKLLQAGRTDYIINASALSYMITQGLPQDSLTLVTSKLLTVCEDDIAWDEFVKSLGIEKPLHIRIITEGALIGSLIEHGFNTDMVIVSDDAGQFNVLIHALCWIHAERLINKLIGLTDEQKEAVKSIRSDIWELYASLKNFKEQPDDRKKADIEAQFDKIFTQKTCFASLNNALKRIYRNKPELLRVLDFPDIPLHNNTSENDIRDYVKRRKVSGSTRSDLGRKCRDTFTSLKKTCRKLNVSFWDYLEDRLSGLNKIPHLSDLIIRCVSSKLSPFFSNEVPIFTAQFSHGLRRAIGGPFSAMRELCYTVPYSNGYTACLPAVFSTF